MKKIGLAGEQNRGQKTDVKNSGRKIDSKNWISRWKNSMPENWCEKLKISMNILWKFFNFFKIVENFSEVLTVFPKLFVTTGITWQSKADWHISGHNWTQWLEFQQCEYDMQSESPSSIVSKYSRDSRTRDFSFTMWV